MTISDFAIDSMHADDVEAFRTLVNQAFVTTFERLIGKVPPGRAVGDRVRNRFYRPDTRVLVVRDERGDVQAALPLQQCGTRAVPGPLAIAPRWQEPWRTGVASALVERLLRQCVELGCTMVDSVTFPHSPAHFTLYWKYGGPIFQALLMSRAVSGAAPSGGTDVVRFSESDENARRTMLSSMREVTERFWPGYDLSADVLHVAQRGLGETYVLLARDRVRAFAVCHFGAGSEAYADEQFFLKYLHVDPELPDREAKTNSFLDYLESEAARLAFSSTAFMVSSARKAAVDLAMQRSYRIMSLDSQWLMAPGTPSLARSAVESFSPEQLAFADWR